jgi:hypothetical protein
MWEEDARRRRTRRRKKGKDGHAIPLSMIGGGGGGSFVKTKVFAQVLSMKAIPSCGDLHRYSRVASFDDIFDFGLQMYQFSF